MSMNNEILNHITDFSGKSLTSKINHGGSSHNAIYRGKNLTNLYTLDEIYSMIYSGLFNDLYVGDYITKTITSSLGGTEEVDFAFAEFNTYKGTGDTNVMNRNHAVMVPRHCFQTPAPMNQVVSTEGAYYNSYMNLGILPSYVTALQEVFGNHLLGHDELLSKTMKEDVASMAGSDHMGASVDWAWYNGYLTLLSEPQLYGTTVCSSSMYDVGACRTQLALFRFNPTLIQGKLGKNGDRTKFWLSGVSSSVEFCVCTATGAAYCLGAAEEHGVRPYFLLG